MSGSTIPAVITALVTTFKAALPTNFVVVDGPDYDPQINFLAVAWAGEGNAAVDVQREIADARRARDQEDYDVHCLLSFHDSGSVAKVRTELFATFELISAALDADQKLGVTGVARAWITDYALTPALHEGGAFASLTFTVNVRAWK